MSSKKNYISMGSANLPSELLKVMNNNNTNESNDKMAMLRLQQQDKQFQLNQQRQNKLDQLAATAANKEETRYQQRRNDLEKAKLSTLAGLTSGSGLAIDAPMTGDRTRDINYTGQVYSPEDIVEIEKTYADGKYDLSGIKKNTPEDLEFEKKYKALSNKDSLDFIENKNKLKIAQLDLADKYKILGEEKTLGEYPGGIPSPIPYGGAKIMEGIARTFSPIADLGRTEKEIAQANIGMDDFNKMIDKRYKGKSQSDVIKEKLKYIDDTRNNRIKKESKTQADEQKWLNNLLETKKLTRTVTDHDVMLSPDKFRTELNSDKQAGYNKIMNNKALDTTGKINAIEVFNKRLAEKNAIYEAKRAVLAKKKEEYDKDKRTVKVHKAKTIIDNADKKDFARFKKLLDKNDKTEKEILEFKILQEKYKKLQQENN